MSSNIRSSINSSLYKKETACSEPRGSEKKEKKAQNRIMEEVHLKLEILKSEQNRTVDLKRLLSSSSKPIILKENKNINEKINRIYIIN